MNSVTVKLLYALRYYNRRRVLCSMGVPAASMDQLTELSNESKDINKTYKTLIYGMVSALWSMFFPSRRLRVEDYKPTEYYVASVLNYTSKYNNQSSIGYAPENLIGKPKRYPNYGDFPDTYMLVSKTF